MSQYILTPPDNLPPFLFSNPAYAPGTVDQLIKWAQDEYSERLRFCASRGYWRELKRLNEDYSPIRILAELNSFRRLAGRIAQAWNSLDRPTRKFLTNAYELRLLIEKGNFSYPI